MGQWDEGKDLFDWWRLLNTSGLQSASIVITWGAPPGPMEHPLCLPPHLASLPFLSPSVSILQPGPVPQARGHLSFIFISFCPEWCLVRCLLTFPGNVYRDKICWEFQQGTQGFSEADTKPAHQGAGELTRALEDMSPHGWAKTQEENQDSK